MLPRRDMSEFYRWEISEENLSNVLQPNIGSVTEPVLLSSLESDPLSSLEPTENLLRSNFDLIPTWNTKWFDSPSLGGGKKKFSFWELLQSLLPKWQSVPVTWIWVLTALKGGEKCLGEGEHTVLPTKDPWEEFSQVQYTSSAAVIGRHAPK